MEPGAVIGQAKPDDGGLSRPDVELVVRGGLGPRPLRIDGFLPARHDKIVDPVLHIRAWRWACRTTAGCWSRSR